MKFIICRVWNISYKDLIKTYPCLEQFNIKPYSKYKYYGEIEIESIEKLIELKDLLKERVIIGNYFLDEDENRSLITIYDDYME